MLFSKLHYQKGFHLIISSYTIQVQFGRTFSSEGRVPPGVLHQTLDPRRSAPRSICKKLQVLFDLVQLLDGSWRLGRAHKMELDLKLSSQVQSGGTCFSEEIRAKPDITGQG